MWSKRFASKDELEYDDSRIAESGGQLEAAKAAAKAVAGSPAFQGRDVQVSVQGHLNAPNTAEADQQLETVTITVTAKKSDQAAPLKETTGNVAGVPDKTAQSRTSPVQHGGADANDPEAEDDAAETTVRGGAKKSAGKTGAAKKGR